MTDVNARLQALDRAQALVRELDGTITYWSSGMVRMYGFSAAEATRRSVHELLKTEFSSSLSEIESEFLERGAWAGEVVQRHRSGEIVIAASQWSLWRTVDRTAVTEVYIDLTAAKRVERDLIAREAHLKSILETVPDAMIVIDDLGMIQLFSSAAERLFGYQARDIVGLNVKTLMPSPYWEHHDGYLQRYARTGEKRIIGSGRVVVGRRCDGLNVPDRACGRGDEFGRKALLYRLYPRFDRAPGSAGTLAGTSVRACTYFASDCHGRNGIGAGARTEPAAFSVN